MNTSTTVTVGSGRSIHWGSEYGTICGAAHRSGRFTAPKTVEGAEVTCKRCAKIMAAKVEEAHAEAVLANEAHAEALEIAFEQKLGRCLSELANRVEQAHAEALEVAEIHAFEQAMYSELVSEGSSPESAREMAYSCRDVNSAWSEPTARTARYDELLRKHAGTVPFRVGR
jgi:hypothetical protein